LIKILNDYYEKVFLVLSVAPLLTFAQKKNGNTIILYENLLPQKITEILPPMLVFLTNNFIPFSAMPLAKFVFTAEHCGTSIFG